MVLRRDIIFELFLITLFLCCLTTSVLGGRLSTIEAKDLAESTKTDIKRTEIAEASNKYNKNKFSKRDDNADDNENDDEEKDAAAAADYTEMVEKNALQPAADTSLSIWGIVRGLWNWIKEDIKGNLLGDDAGAIPAVGEGRTFGKIRRLQMALIPIVFKFGVLSAMIAFLVAVGVKTLFLVKMLVVINLLALLAKFFSFKNNYGHVENFSGPPAPMWSPYVSTGWHSMPPEDHHLSKEIHLHIHGGHLQPQATSYSYGSGASGQTHGWEKRIDPYSAYDNIALPVQQNELTANQLPQTLNSVVSKGQQYGRNFSEKSQ